MALAWTVGRAAALVLVAGILISSPSAAVGKSSTRLSSSYQPLLSEDCISELSTAMISSSVAPMLVTPSSQNSSRSHQPSQPMSMQSAVVSEVSRMAAAVCMSAAFSSLASRIGTAHPGLELQASGGGVNWANFTLTWQTQAGGTTTAHEAVWSGNLPAGTLVGPYIYSGPSPGPFGCCVVQFTWTGWEFWAANSETVAQTGAYDGIVPYGVPPSGSQHSVPSGTLVDALAGVWVGTSPQPGGQGGLLQTGYVYDASHPSASYCVSGTDFSGDCNYGLWWEYYPNTAPYPYSGDPQAPVGDIFAVNVYQTAAGSPYWTTYVRDNTLWQIWSHNEYVGSSYAPKYSQFIMETPEWTLPGSSGPAVMQVPVFNQVPVRWEYGFVNHHRLLDLYNNGTVNIYQLTQCDNWYGAPDYNTNQNYIMNSGGYFGTSSWPQMSFNNAQYDWKYVMGYGGNWGCVW